MGNASDLLRCGTWLGLRLRRACGAAHLPFSSAGSGALSIHQRVTERGSVSDSEGGDS